MKGGEEKLIKKGSLLVMLGIVVLFAAASIHAGTEVADVIKMENKAYTEHKKGIVEFTHKKHADHKDISCSDCHHVYKDGKNVWKEGDDVQKCEACHKEVGKPPKGMKKAEKIKKYQKYAIHANCKGCHKKMIDKESEMGKKLRKCSGCHPKNKK